MTQASLRQMDMRHDIDDEDEELTLEAFVDTRMSDWDMSQVRSVYSVAGNCLHERKNRRPLIAQVKGCSNWGFWALSYKTICKKGCRILFFFFSTLTPMLSVHRVHERVKT